MSLENFLPYSYVEMKNLILNSTESDKLKEFRLSSLELLANSEFPNKNLESWRKISLRNFSLKTFFSLDENSEFKLDEKFLPFLEKIKLKYKNSFLVLLQLVFLKKVNFIELNDSNKEILKTEFLKFGSSFFNLNFILVKKNSTVQLEEEICSTENNLSVYFPFSFIYLEENSSVDYLEKINLNQVSVLFRNLYSILEKNSNINMFSIFLNGYKGKSFIETDLIGSNSKAELIGISSLRGSEFHDLECSMNHLASNSNSLIRYKTLVNDKSHHVFTGNLFIPNESKKVEASQINHNLSLNKKARAESMPKLEVYAEDVKCSHGATVSEVNDQQLFYLLSRGISFADAKKLIMEGFLKEILDKIPDEETKENLLVDLLKKQKL